LRPPRSFFDMFTKYCFGLSLAILTQTVNRVFRASPLRLQRPLKTRRPVLDRDRKRAGRGFLAILLAIPRMQLERGDLSQRGESLSAVDFQIGLAIAREQAKFSLR